MSEFLSYSPEEIKIGKWEAATDEVAKTKVEAATLLNAQLEAFELPVVSGKELALILINHPRIALSRQRYESYIKNPEARKWYISSPPVDTLLSIISSYPILRKETMISSILTLMDTNPPLRRVI